MAARRPGNELDETAHFGAVRSQPNSSASIGSQVLPATNPDMGIPHNVHALAQAQGSGEFQIIFSRVGTLTYLSVLKLMFVTTNKAMKIVRSVP